MACSNACKFTPSGGQLIIKTKLIMPEKPPFAEPEPEVKEAHSIMDDGTYGTTASFPRELIMYLTFIEKEEKMSHGLSSTLLSQHDGIYSKPPPLEWIVVRIEVTDTGCGIHPRDMVQSKLFCRRFDPHKKCVADCGPLAAFNQTEMGRQQGMFCWSNCLFSVRCLQSM